MQADDIIWGGNNKCEVKLRKDIQLSVGVIAKIEYDYIKEKFTMKYQGDVASIEVDSNGKELLENIYLYGRTPATLVRVIDKENLNLVVEIKIFSFEATFNTIQSIRILINEEIIEKMRSRDKENPIDYLNNSFKYQDMIFVKDYSGKGSRFTILSKDRVLHVIKEDNVYRASNLMYYDRNRVNRDEVIILRGPIEFVNSTHGAMISREVSEKMAKISSGGDYFDIWEAYNDLDRIFAFKQATENGILEYSSYTCELTDAFEYCFTLKGNSLDSFPEGAQIDCTDNSDILHIAEFKESRQMSGIYSTSIGTFSRTDSNKCYIVDYNRSSQIKIPNQGYLFYSVAGDTVRLARREKAKRDIVNHETPLSNLSLIIDKGLGMERQTKNETPITNMLCRKFPQYNFNDEQKAAIEVAINTPDIALILGPPGTGKTTVIKAIIARYEEYYKKYNDKQIPKVLVTSFQHEAVENVITGIDGNGIPSNRKGGKRNEVDRQATSINEWCNKTTNRLLQVAEELGVSNETRFDTLRDRIYAWSQKGKNSSEGIQILKEEVAGSRLKISKELNDDINSILARAMISDSKTLSKKQELEEDEAEEIKSILTSQRLTAISYEDDGKKQAYRLKFAILQNTIDNCENTDFIDKLLATKGKDERIFAIYVSTVKKFIDKYMKDDVERTALSDVITIEQCLKRLATELNKSYLLSIENRNEAIGYVLKNYIEKIQDQDEIQRIIEKYSNITAATCQQSMEVGKFVSNKKYDLVIVDEAARANPLDLLIPLSMGKQIILVGDFLQLPHMLDPEVVKQFETDQKMKDLGILKQSLFEKLYRAFDSQKGVRRTARLSKQYRMNTVIGEFASEAFYEEFKLDSSEIDDSEKQANIGMYKNQPIAWLNLDKNKYGMEDGKMSKFRENEAKRVIEEARKVLKVNSSKTIGIISFYKKQAELLQKIANEDLTDTQLLKVSIGTVDAFQGKEFDVVYLSCVRANTIGMDDLKHRVGHIQDKSRLCVSFTRAKQLLVVVGDRDTVECVPSIGKFIKECEKGGTVYNE